MTLEMRKQQFQFIIAKLAGVAASADTSEGLAARIKAILAELGDVVSGFPEGALMRRIADALAAQTDIIAQSARGNGMSQREALRRFAGQMAATFRGQP